MHAFDMYMFLSQDASPSIIHLNRVKMIISPEKYKHNEFFSDS